jgi:hypothetical protein
MAYGFVSAYFLVWLYARIVAPSSYLVIMSVSAWLVLAGLFGGSIPDIDQLESLGFVHKKTCHYILGYLVAAVILVVAANYVPQYQLPTLMLACVTLAAWLHSFMDLFDGFRDDDPRQGIYEHIWGRWLSSRQWIGFAGTWEWVLQAFAALCFIPISANLSQLVVFPTVQNWKLGTFVYAGIWGVSVVYDVWIQASKRRRQEREFAGIRGFRGIR